MSGAAEWSEKVYGPIGQHHAGPNGAIAQNPVTGGGKKSRKQKYKQNKNKKNQKSRRRVKGGSCGKNSGYSRSRRL